MEFSAASDHKHDPETGECMIETGDNVITRFSLEPVSIPYDVIGANNWISLYKEDITTEEARVIIEHLVPEWWSQFKAKNNEYGTHADDLGMRGQFADIHRKMKKLRNALWDGKPLTHEQPREVILDLIGHMFLTLAKGDKDGWG